MSKQWPFPHYIDVCHCNDDDFEWNNVTLIYLWWMEFHLWVLQVSYISLNHLKSSYSVYLHLEKIWCHFPKGRISDFVAIRVEVHNNLYKLNNDSYENLKFSLKHPLPLFRNSSRFWSTWKAIFNIYPGGIGTPIC